MRRYMHQCLDFIAGHDVVIPNKHDNWSNRSRDYSETVRLVLVKDTYHIYEIGNDNLKQNLCGYLVKVLVELVLYSNVKWSLSEYFGEVSFRNVFALLAQNETDVAITSIRNDFNRLEWGDFSFQVKTSKFIKILSKRIPLSNSIFNFIRVFDYEVWFCLLFALILAPLLVSLSNKLMNKTFTFWYNFGSEFWSFIRVMLQQGLDRRPVTITGKILYTIWLLLISVIITSFSADILSHYISAVKYTEINSIEDAMTSKDIDQIILTRNVINRTKLCESQHNFECIRYPTIWCDVCRRAKIVETFYKDRKQLEPDMESKLADGKLAIIGSYESLLNFIHKSDDTEFLQLSRQGYFDVQFVLIYNKNLKQSLKLKFDKLLKRFLESGLSEQWESEAQQAFYKKKDEFQYQNKFVKQMRSLNLYDIIGVFYLLLIGIILSNIIFIIERSFESCFHKRINFFKFIYSKSSVI